MNSPLNGHVHRATAAGADSGALPAAGSPARILCVDDDAALRKLGERLLVRAGYVVDTAADGEEAWAALQHSHYDLLVTDHQMPRLTGVELMRKMQLASMTVPVILISGGLFALPPDVLASLECEAILAKPFTYNQLISVVQEVLRAGVSTKLPRSVRSRVVVEFHGQAEPHQSWGLNER